MQVLRDSADAAVAPEHADAVILSGYPAELVACATELLGGMAPSERARFSNGPSSKAWMGRMHS